MFSHVRLYAAQAHERLGTAPCDVPEPEAARPVAGKPAVKAGFLARAVQEEDGPLRRRLQELAGQLVGQQVEADVAFVELGLSSGAAVILRDELQRVTRRAHALEALFTHSIYI